MTIWDAAVLYLEINLLLALCALLGALALRLGPERLRLSARTQLRLAYLAIAASVVLPCLLALAPTKPIFRPAAQVWSSPTMRRDVPDGFGAGGAGVQLLAAPPVRLGDGATQLGWVTLGVVTLLCGLQAGRYLRGVQRLSRFCARQTIVRRSRRVRVAITSETPVPLSARLPWPGGGVYVVVPDSYLHDASAFRVALRHELQHHRQRDTSWLHALEALRALCAWNPAVHRLCRQLADLQEYACDEALVGRRGFSPREYARCLVQAAEHSARGRPAHSLVGTAGMASSASSSHLLRRLEMLKRRNDRVNGRMRRALGVGAAALVLGGFAGVTIAAKGALRDQRITMERAQELAAAAVRDGDGFPIVVDQLVLDQLNRYAGTPDGRHFMHEALVRMQDYREAVEGRLTARGLPLELAAIPIVESGYANLAESENRSGCCAGLWQFTRATARRYGLTVDERVDERRVATRATEAALSYLADLEDQFRDWPLAVSAYNMGEVAVQRAIEEGGTRDAWELARRGRLERYLSAVTAAIIVLRNPELLE